MHIAIESEEVRMTLTPPAKARILKLTFPSVENSLRPAYADWIWVGEVAKMAELVLRREERRGEDGELSMLCFLGLLERLRAIAFNFDLNPIF